MGIEPENETILSMTSPCDCMNLLILECCFSFTATTQRRERVERRASVLTKLLDGGEITGI